MRRQQGGQRGKGAHHDLLFGTLPKHMFSGTIAVCLLEPKNGNGHARFEVGCIEGRDEVDTAVESVWIWRHEEGLVFMKRAPISSSTRR